MTTITDQVLFARLRGAINRGWIPIPDHYGYRGTGAPGDILEELLGLDGRNLDIPDGGKWELKYHSGKALMTLFHLEAKPKGHMRHIVQEFGWLDGKGRKSFRHTIRGRSERGFYVVNESGRITVRNNSVSDMVWPYWTHDALTNAFVSKLRRLISVKGQKKNGKVRYMRASLYREPSAAHFIEAVARGIVAIDFDARTTNGRGLRNHGTKFRIDAGDLSKLYAQVDRFD